MPGKGVLVWLDRVKQVGREFHLAELAFSRFHGQAGDDPGLLPPGFELKEVAGAAAGLEGTYLVRVFSEFETALRHFLRWKKLKQPSSTELLINKVRDRMHIPPAAADEVHLVRKYRNSLVHDVEDEVDPVPFRAATTALTRFLSWLKRYW